MIVAIGPTNAGFSPKLSYVRPHRSSWATQTQGRSPTECRWPAPLPRWLPDLFTSAGSRVAPRPMLCGNTVAPSTLPCPWTASTP